jgi:hypothetical protein
LPCWQQQQLVDRVHEHARVISPSAFLQLIVVLQHLGIDVLVQPLPERRTWRDSSSVFVMMSPFTLHEHLLDDVRAHGGGLPRGPLAAVTTKSIFFIVSVF